LVLVLTIKRILREINGGTEGLSRDLPLLTPRKPPGNPQESPRKAPRYTEQKQNKSHSDIYNEIIGNYLGDNKIFGLIPNRYFANFSLLKNERN